MSDGQLALLAIALAVVVSLMTSIALSRTADATVGRPLDVVRFDGVGEFPESFKFMERSTEQTWWVVRSKDGQLVALPRDGR